MAFFDRLRRHVGMAGFPMLDPILQTFDAFADMGIFRFRHRRFCMLQRTLGVLDEGIRMSLFAVRDRFFRMLDRLGLMLVSRGNGHASHNRGKDECQDETRYDCLAYHHIVHELLLCKVWLRRR